MNVNFRLKEPDDMIATLTITGTVKELKELDAQLCDKHPSYKVSFAIHDAIQKASESFYSVVKEDC